MNEPAISTGMLAVRPAGGAGSPAPIMMTRFRHAVAGVRRQDPGLYQLVGSGIPSL